MKKEFAPSNEKEGEYTVVNELPFEAYTEPIKKEHLTLEEYQDRNKTLADWLSQTGDVKQFYSTAFEIVKAQKEQRAAKRQAKFERTNPQNFKYLLPKPFEEMDFPDEIKALIVQIDASKANGFGAILTNAKIPFAEAQNLGLKQDKYHSSRNLISVDVYRVSDAAENFKSNTSLAAAENITFDFSTDFNKAATMTFNRQLFNFNKFHDKFKVQTGDIVRMNDKMFYIDDNKTFKRIMIEKENIPFVATNTPISMDKIVPIESKELSAYVENFKREVGETAYNNYCDRFQRILVEGRKSSNYNHYLSFINNQALSYGLNKSVKNSEGWEAADILYVFVECASNPDKSLSDIQKDIHFNSPGAVISNDKHYAKNIMEKAAVTYPQIKELMNDRGKEASVEEGLGGR